MEPLTATVLALAALCALTTVVAAFYIRFSGPVAAAVTMRDWLERLEGLESQWRAKTIEIEQVLDAITRDFENLTRARNRLTAIESKARQREEREAGPSEDRAPAAGDREAWLARAQRQGLFGTS